MLSVLLIGVVLHGYQTHLLSGLNAVNRPDFAFRSKDVLIVANVVLNFVLVWWLGWLGAAVATACAPGLALIVAFRYLRRVVTFATPVSEIGRQVIAASVMGVLIFAGRSLLLDRFYAYEFVVVMGLVGFGAVVYFGVLMFVSEQFRGVVFRNLGFARRPIVRITVEAFRSGRDDTVFF